MPSTRWIRSRLWKVCGRLPDNVGEAQQFSVRPGELRAALFWRQTLPEVFAALLSSPPTARFPVRGRSGAPVLQFVNQTAEENGCRPDETCLKTVPHRTVRSHARGFWKNRSCARELAGTEFVVLICRKAFRQAANHDPNGQAQKNCRFFLSNTEKESDKFMILRRRIVTEMPLRNHEYDALYGQILTSRKNMHVWPKKLCRFCMSPNRKMMNERDDF